MNQSNHFKPQSSFSSSSPTASVSHISLEPTSLLRKMVTRVGNTFLAEEWERKYYADKYSCCPPPLFIPIISVLQVVVFIYYLPSTPQAPGIQTPVMTALEDSPLIYHPLEKQQVWRFLTYMLLHEGWLHLTFNLTVQILLGLPLEMVHGSIRLSMIYMSGVLAGSLATSIFDSHAKLLGASGGVYALLAGHLANVLLNFHNMEMGLLRAVGVFLVASVDVGVAIYDRYARESYPTPPVSFLSHISGALAGLTIGLVVLKNFEQKLREQLLWWICLGVYLSALLFAVLYNTLK